MQRPFRVALLAISATTAIAGGLSQNLLAALVPTTWARSHLGLVGFALILTAALALAVDAVLRRHEPQPVVRLSRSQLLQHLARTVLDQTVRAEVDHGVRHGVPLTLSWTNAGEALQSSWAEVHGIAGYDDPIRLDGSINEIGTRYRQVPTGRLVILGRAGSGKTVLVTRLTRELVEDHQAARPVPLLLDAHAWPPGCDLHTWLVQEAQRMLRSAGLSVVPDDQVRELVVERLVWPVIDGLDEVPINHQREILRALEVAGPVIVTSREQEYREAHRRDRGLSASIAIVLRDLDPTESVMYLHAKARKTTSPGGARTVWDPLLARLRAGAGSGQSDEPYRALRRPLLVKLAAEVYARPDTDPTELFDRDRFPSSDAAEEYLFSAFMERAYPDSRSIPARRDQTLVSGWTSEEARRWNRRLAVLLTESWVPVISPWALSLGRFGLELVSIIPIVALVVVFFRGSGSSGSPSAVLVFGAVLFGRAYGSRDKDQDVSLRNVFRSGNPAPPINSPIRAGRWFLPSLGLYLLASTTLIVTLQVVLGNDDETLLVAASGVVVVVVLFAVAGRLRRRLAIYVGPAVDPDASLTRMRRVASAEVTTFALLVAVPVGGYLVASLPSDRVQWATIGLAVLGSCLIVGLQTAWGSWIITRIWLTARRDVPIRLSTFLREARRVGVLRHNGDVVVFRHQLLAEHLLRSAVEDMSPGRSRTDALRSAMYLRAVDRRSTWALDGLAALVTEQSQTRGEWHPNTFCARLDLAVAKARAGQPDAATRDVLQIMREADARLAGSAVKRSGFAGQLAYALAVTGQHEEAAMRYLMAANLLANARIAGMRSGGVFQEEIEFYLDKANEIRDRYLTPSLTSDQPAPSESP